MIMNQKGLEIIKKYEGFYPRAYKCPGGVWTIGFGRTRGVRVDDVITREQAEKFLIEDIEEIEAELKYVIGDCMVNINQWSALVSLVYNIGIGAFSRSTLRKYLPYSKRRAAEEFLVWNKSKGKTLNGLIARRAEEQRLFLE